jgi:outer membrane protein assembly factor BamD
LTKFTLIFAIVTALSGLLLMGGGCGGSKSLATMSAHEFYDLGMHEYDKGRYYKAIDYFQSVVFNYPGESIVDTAQYYLGLSYFSNKDYELAGAEFNRLVINYPASAFFEQAVYMRAVSHFYATPGNYGLDQNDLHEAIRQFEDFLTDFPESELIEDVQSHLSQARMRLARKYYESGVIYSRMRALEAARTYFQIVIDDYTDTEYGARASYQYAEMEFRLKHFDQAHQKFRDFQIVFPEHEWVKKAQRRTVRAAFRSGEVAFEKGDYALAEKKFEEFRADYPDDKQTKKADRYLEKIRRATQQTRQSDENES